MSSLLNESGDYNELLSDTLRVFFYEHLHEAEFFQDSRGYSDFEPYVPSWKFIGESGINPNRDYNHVPSPLTTNDMKGLHKEQSIIIKFSMGDFETQESWNDGVYGSQTIYIDIFGKHNWQESVHVMEKARSLIDKVLFENGRRQKLPKAYADIDGDYTTQYLNWFHKEIIRDGDSSSYPDLEYSQFSGFLDYSIDWERIHENQEHGIVEQIAGELRVSTQRGFD